MFNKKTIGILLSAVLTITSVMPAFANESNIAVEFNESEVAEPQELTKMDYWQGDFRPTVPAFGADTPSAAYDWGYIKQSDGSYRSAVSTPLQKKHEIDFSYDYSDQDWEEFIDDSDPGQPVKSKRITFSANEKNKYTIETPKLKVNGELEHTGWGYHFIIEGDGGVEENLKCEYVIPAGISFTFDETMPMKKNSKMSLYPVLEYTTQSINEKFQSVSFNEGGHSVSANINITPAYTGSKIKAGDVIENFEIDGQKYSADKIKVKVSGDKKVGSEVTVTLQKVKGLDKETNKLLKGKELGKVTIRPIVAQEITASSKTFTKEGQIVIKTKGDKLKSAYVLVPKKGKYSENTKAKKLKVKVKDKSGTHVTYDQSAKAVTFSDTFVTGSAMEK